MAKRSFEDKDKDVPKCNLGTRGSALISRMSGESADGWRSAADGKARCEN
jgi:hypothetical protein